MRLQKYLSEKFLSAYNQYGHTYEIFKNPSRKELKSELDNGNGFRFIIDAINKNIYFTNADIFHRDMLKVPEVQSELDMRGTDWEKYWHGKSTKISYIFMGDCESDMGNINSDVLSSIASEGYTHALDMLEELAGHNYSWVSKYGMNPNQITNEIKYTIERLRE